MAFIGSWYIEWVQIFSLYVLHTEIYRRQFNPQCTSSDGSRFHPHFMSLLFYFQASFDYISRFLSGRNTYYDKITVLTFSLLPPTLWSIILQNIFLFHMILSHLLSWKITSLVHITMHLPFTCLWYVRMCKTCYDVKYCNICLIFI